MLLPKRVKHRKQHRGRMTGEATRGNSCFFFLEPYFLTHEEPRPDKSKP